MNRVARLRPVETVAVDQCRIAGLHARLGADRGDAALGAAMEDLAYWLYHFNAAARRGDSAQQIAKARQIARLARMTGLRSLQGVAVALAGIDARAAPVAHAAVAERLTRVGEASILSVWDLEDLSI